MKTFLGLAVATATIACSTTPGGTSSSASSAGTPTAAATGTGGGAGTTGSIASSTGGGTSGGTGTGGQCQTSWPPRDCFAIAVCECSDGTEQDFGCVGPPTCGDACCAHGGAFSDAGIDDAGMCQTDWPPTGCLAESICACGDGTGQEFGCLGPPTCSDACCGHDGPGRAPSDAGEPVSDAGVCQTWAPLPCQANFLCQCENGMTEEAGCEGPPTCAAACCGHGGTAASDGGASDGGVCESSWPPRSCLAESLCNCGDGTTQEFGCVGPPTCGDACCGHDGPASDAGMIDRDAGPGTVDGGDAGEGTGPIDAGPAEIPGDAGLTIDGGICPYYPPLTCGAIRECPCGDGTDAEAGCAGPPTCNDACCGHDGSSQN